jgi:hypothetical protein
MSDEQIVTGLQAMVGNESTGVPELDESQPGVCTSWSVIC